jgi:Spo0E like sporulation regulatory protein
MNDHTVQERIIFLREELYRISSKLNYELTHPRLVEVSQQLDQLLNQCTRLEQKA